MPAQILHALFGEDLLEELGRRMAPGSGFAGRVMEGVRGEYRAAFSLGCQGPDIFYHAQMSRPVALEYGSLLHRRGYGAFSAELLDAAPPSLPGKIGALEVFALGFMTHAFLDRAAHPYIVYKSGWVSRNDPETAKYAGSHVFFERILDVLMLEYLRGEAPSSWDQETLLAGFCVDPPPGLKELLAETLIRVFPGRAGQDPRLNRRVENTFGDCAAFYTVTAPRLTSLRCRFTQRDRWRILQEIPPAYLYPERFPLDIDYLNLARSSWRYPVVGGVEDHRSFPDLYRDTVMAAAESLEKPLARCLAREPASLTEMAGAIGNGGLSIQDAEGRPRAPGLADPLPLDIALEGQRRF